MADLATPNNGIENLLPQLKKLKELMKVGAN
jgi:hypothetical protein